MSESFHNTTWPFLIWRALESREENMYILICHRRDQQYVLDNNLILYVIESSRPPSGLISKTKFILIK